jgi:hypothetical protein
MSSRTVTSRPAAPGLLMRPWYRSPRHHLAAHHPAVRHAAVSAEAEEPAHPAGHVLGWVRHLVHVAARVLVLVHGAVWPWVVAADHQREADGLVGRLRKERRREALLDELHGHAGPGQVTGCLVLHYEVVADCAAGLAE